MAFCEKPPKRVDLFKTRNFLPILWYIGSYTITAKPIKSLELHSASLCAVLKSAHSLRVFVNKTLTTVSNS